MAARSMPISSAPRDADLPQLRDFLKAEPLGTKWLLCLPHFKGPVTLDSPSLGLGELKYPGGTLSQRDARAATYVALLLGRVAGINDVEVQAGQAFESMNLGIQNSFLFGSRSNAATLSVVSRFCRQFSFEFSNDWQIRFADGSVFSIPDPSRLDERSYSSHVDYGVIARVQIPGSSGSTFILAGLGSRATEGCAYHFCQQWQNLMKSFGTGEFVLVLEFPAPVKATHASEVKRLSAPGNQATTSG